MHNKLDSIIKRCRKMISDGESAEAMLRVLRNEGFSKVQSIKTLAEIKNISINESKKTVHGSDTWSDARQKDEDLHRYIGDALEKDKW